MFDFTGKTVLVTGASMGLGEGFAHGFADAGADLVLTARSADLLESVADACRAKGSTVTVVPGDVSVEADVARVVATGIEAHGRIDVLINNAGVSDMRGVAPESFDMDTWNWIMSIDLNGAFMYLRDVGRHMLEAGGGSIVNICSIMGHGANELNVIAYTAAKGALRNLTLQLGCEWADRGVRVNSVSPGFIVTEMVRPALEGMGMDRVDRQPHPDAPDRRTRRDRRPGAVPRLRRCELRDGPRPQRRRRHERRQRLLPDPADPSGVERRHRPRVGAGYEGVVPRPDWYEAMKAGIPGIHYTPDA